MYPILGLKAKMQSICFIQQQSCEPSHLLTCHAVRESSDVHVALWPDYVSSFSGSLSAELEKFQCTVEPLPLVPSKVS